MAAARSTLSVGFLMLFFAAPAAAQLDLRGTYYADSLELRVPGVYDESPRTYMTSLLASYRSAPWTVSAEGAFGGNAPLWFSGTALDREKYELAVAYSLSESLALMAGGRADDITVKNIRFFALPVEVAEFDMTNFFVGASYQSDPQRRAGISTSARFYRGSADVRTSFSPSISGKCEGFRADLGVPIRTKHWSITPGVAYEEFNLPDSAIEIGSKPILYLQFRYIVP